MVNRTNALAPAPPALDALFWYPAPPAPPAPTVTVITVPGSIDASVPVLY